MAPGTAAATAEMSSIDSSRVSTTVRAPTRGFGTPLISSTALLDHYREAVDPLDNNNLGRLDIVLFELNGQSLGISLADVLGVSIGTFPCQPLTISDIDATTGSAQTLQIGCNKKHTIIAKCQK